LRALSNSGSLALISRVAGSKVWLKAVGEARDRNIWAPADWWRRWRIAVHFGEIFRSSVVAGVRAVVEVCGLVHVDPQRVTVRTISSIEERQELLCPILLRFRVEPVREITRTKPDETLI
jgi:hypothetical protein